MRNVTKIMNGVYVFTPSTDKPMRTKEESEQRNQQLLEKWERQAEKFKQEVG